MPLTGNSATEKDLAVINRQIAEIKKKIQLSEGQRKAHFEECDAERKKNADKINQLKKSIKDLYQELGKPGFCEELTVRPTCTYARDINALKRKKNHEVADILDNRIIDLKKKFDILRHHSKLAQTKMKQLADEYQNLLQKNVSHNNKELSHHSLSKQVCVLENQIHRVEMNMMEAEHVKKKYRSIRCSLLDDSVEFESTLRRLESMIQKQEIEIQHLKEINAEALGLRDITKGTLVKQETSALNAGKQRERQLQDFRIQVEERRLELERLERRIFPTSRPILHQDSLGSSEVTQSVAEDSVVAATNDYLENAFSKLKEATGESETEEVLHRFLSQKETMTRLTYLKNITEEEKRDLEIKKDFMMAELEAFKFAEVKDKEQNMEEVEKYKQLIQEQTKIKTKLDEQIRRITKQLEEINEILYNFCVKLKDVGNVPVPVQSKDLSSIKGILEVLEHKITNAINMMKECDAEKVLSQENALAIRSVADNSWMFQQAQVKTTQESRPSVLVTSETDEEEDVPTRSYLKRQAQIIVDAKSRRKQFNFSRARK